MPRLFTGIEIPQSQRTLLSLAQSGLKNTRWIEPHDLHLTLKFIGDVSIQTANDVVDALSSREWKAPQIQLAELKSFGGSKPRSIHASIQNNGALENLARAQNHLLERVGLPPEHRQFTPHVTIARLNNSTDAAPVARYLSQYSQFSAPMFTPKRFVLFSAKESTGGGPYKIEQSWDFT